MIVINHTRDRNWTGNQGTAHKNLSSIVCSQQKIAEVVEPFTILRKRDSVDDSTRNRPRFVMAVESSAEVIWFLIFHANCTT